MHAAAVAIGGESRSSAGGSRASTGFGGRGLDHRVAGRDALPVMGAAPHRARARLEQRHCRLQAVAAVHGEAGPGGGWSRCCTRRLPSPGRSARVACPDGAGRTTALAAAGSMPGWSCTPRHSSRAPPISARAAEAQAAGLGDGQSWDDAAGGGRLGVGFAQEASVSLVAQDPFERVEVLLVRVRQRVQVLLRGLDLRVPHPIHHALEVGSACEQPRGVRVSQVVHAYTEVDLRLLDRR